MIFFRSWTDGRRCTPRSSKVVPAVIDYMWSPADIAAFPTPDDLTRAKSAIQDTEARLQTAISELVEAQRRVTSLERDLSERKAWIAPVRRLTSDALSLIFEFSGMEGWKPLMNIAAVSKAWRNIALKNPRAWAFHTFESCVTPYFFQFILDRTGHLPLHVNVARKIPAELLTGISSRLRCLKTTILPPVEANVVFAHVKRLSLYGFPSLSMTAIDINRFPVLESLDCSIYLFSSEADASIRTDLRFAPLKTIEFDYGETYLWLPILRCIRDSLASMSVRYADLQPLGTQDVIHFPKLIHLQLQRSYGEEAMLFPLNIETPILETLQVDFQETYSCLRDTSTVEYLRIDEEGPTIASFPKLRVLFVCGSVLAVLEQLLSDANLCPNLESIELAQSIITQREKNVLLEVKSGRSQPIKVTEGWTSNIPGYIETWVRAVSSQVHVFLTILVRSRYAMPYSGLDAISNTSGSSRFIHRG